MEKPTKETREKYMADKKFAPNTLLVMEPRGLEVDAATLLRSVEMLGDIAVLRELRVEVGYEIETGWVDGRLHLPDSYDEKFLEAKITTPAGDVSAFLTINYREIQANGAEGTPYVKHASPLGAGTGRYEISVTAVANRVFVRPPVSGPIFLFSLTPRVKLFVDGVADPVVDVSYPAPINGTNSTRSESTGTWFIQYTAG